MGDEKNAGRRRRAPGPGGPSASRHWPPVSSWHLRHSPLLLCTQWASGAGAGAGTASPATNWLLLPQLLLLLLLGGGGRRWRPQRK